MVVDQAKPSTAAYNRSRVIPDRHEFPVVIKMAMSSLPVGEYASVFTTA
jgi:hypothetical protein